MFGKKNKENTTAEKIRGEVKKQSTRNLSEKVAYLVPGYHGYKAKEIRREADKALRTYIYKQLKDCKRDLNLVQEMLVDYNVENTWEQMDRLMALVDKVAERINHADYGYSGFFDSTKIREPELDRMYEFDAMILDDVDAFRGEIKSLKEELESGNFDNSFQRVFSLRRTLDDIDKKFGDRRSYMLEFV
ncbi:MAG: hypothetical protein KIH08_13025 [Candidatus Freyarchaeota archaeon]|nr:hypothetical protein [Candidatus Jordarchaeia archaeon]MBS7268988.1 hypothetical protein [Candidatus Jordarchaeia archaeon]